MKTLNQLKIGDIVYDLAAKFDAEDNNIKDTYSTKEYVTQKISELVNSATEIGLDQVNNTSDMNKPISTATQAALDGKVDKVPGKQLSTNDYSAEEKSTVAQLKADVEQLKSTVATLTTSLQELKAKA